MASKVSAIPSRPGGGPHRLFKEKPEKSMI